MVFRCGIAAGLATGIAFALRDISVKQTIMAGLLTVGGLTVAVTSDPETAERLGFRAGLKAGSLRRRWRSVFGRRGKDRP